MPTPKPYMALDASQEMWETVPEHLREGLARYLDDGVIPGSFLTACLSNDLITAATHAHPALTLEDLRTLMQFIYTGCPRESWGSPLAVTGWEKHEFRLEMTERRKERNG